jgi:trigger factor
VTRQLGNLMNNAKDRLRSQGLKDEDIESNTGEIEKKLKPQAREQVKVFFLLNEIAAAENIKVEPKEVDKAIEVMANQFKKDKKKLLEEYEDKNLLQHLIGQIREEKTIEFLVKEAEIKEG